MNEHVCAHAMRSLTILALVFSACLATVARADVVENPPASCPAGSTPRTSHSGPFCAPTEECTAGGVCPGGGGCTTIRQCIETRGCGGMSFPDSAPCTLEHVTGLCGSDGSCASGVCRDRSVCPAPGTPSSSGCSCRAAPSASSASWLAIALGLTVLATRRATRTRR